MTLSLTEYEQQCYAVLVPEESLKYLSVPRRLHFFTRFRWRKQTINQGGWMYLISKRWKGLDFEFFAKEYDFDVNDTCEAVVVFNQDRSEFQLQPVPPLSVWTAAPHAPVVMVTPLAVALFHNDYQLIEYLLNLGANPDKCFQDFTQPGCPFVNMWTYLDSAMKTLDVTAEPYNSLTRLLALPHSCIYSLKNGERPVKCPQIGITMSIVKTLSDHGCLGKVAVDNVA